jgi:hypothetical protein
MLSFRGRAHVTHRNVVQTQVIHQSNEGGGQGRLVTLFLHALRADHPLSFVLTSNHGGNTVQKCLNVSQF